MKGLKYISLLLLCLGSMMIKAQVNVPNGVTTPSQYNFTIAYPYNYSSGTRVNWIQTRDFHVPVTDTALLGSLTGSQVTTSTAYSDGLGRPIQTVTKAATSADVDMVAAVFYDSNGRRPGDLLPFATNTNNGKFKLDAFYKQSQYHTIRYPYEVDYFNRTAFDDTTLYRATMQLRAGSSNVGTGNGKINRIMLNDLAEGVRKWTYIAGSVPVSSATYAAGTLFVTETINEDGKRTRSYRDVDGKIILNKVEVTGGTGHQGWLCTYMVYDDQDRLSSVLTPKLVDNLQSGNWTITQAAFDALCYKYEYDNRNRTITKKLPGQASVYIIYDNTDKPVLLQTGTLRQSNSWLFVKYDALDRVIIGGRFLNSGGLSRTGLATAVAGSSSNSFVQFLQSDIAANTYTNTSSISDAELYGLVYFDDYTNGPTGFQYSNAAIQALANGTNGVTYPRSTETKGMPTGNMTRVMNGTSVTSAWTSGVMYYDTYGQLIQAQQMNAASGHDTVSVKYDFSGIVISTLSAQYNPGATAANHVPYVRVQRSYLYDNYGRLSKVSQKVNDEPYYRQIGKYEYDSLGRLRKKTYGANAEVQDFTYKVWGALEGINKAYCETGTGNNFFGQIINYDFGFTNTVKNGMPSGMRWRNKGSSNIQRAYGYSYDAAGRLTAGEYSQSGGTGWSNATENYSAMNMAYDANGNLTHMDQWGTKIGYATPFKMDNLSYTYKNGGLSNQLDKVADTNINGYGFGEFVEPAGTSGNTDYAYDSMGNATQDVNRNITAITYDYNNKPVQISFTNNRSIKFTYDAAGQLLRKQITENGNATHTIDYLGGLEYTDSTLTSIAHEEGRTRPKIVAPTAGGTQVAYEYDYFIKDYQGNTRSLVTEEPAGNWEESHWDGHTLTFTGTIYDPSSTTLPGSYTVGQRTYVVTSELANAGAEQSVFSNVDSTRELKPGSTNASDQMSTGLSAADGKIIGPSIMLRVMAGDKITVNTLAMYEAGDPSQYTSNATAEQLASALFTALSGGGAYHTVNESNIDPQFTYNSVTGSQFVSAMQDLKNRNTDDGNKPQAFLNYIMLDDKLNVVDEHSGFVQTTEPDAWTTLAVPEMEMTRSGYMIVFLSNESNLRVHFDDLKIQHYKGTLLEENHYYPYGLTLSSKSYTGVPDNNNLYTGQQLNHKEFSDGTGLEWYNMDARQYDAQIGRWHGADLLAEGTVNWSPYHYGFSNPVVYTDPSGLAPKDGYLDGYHFSDERDEDVREEYWDEGFREDGPGKIVYGEKIGRSLTYIGDEKNYDGEQWGDNEREEEQTDNNARVLTDREVQHLVDRKRTYDSNPRLPQMQLDFEARLRRLITAENGFDGIQGFIDHWYIKAPDRNVFPDGREAIIGIDDNGRFVMVDAATKAVIITQDAFTIWTMRNDVESYFAPIILSAIDIDFMGAVFHESVHGWDYHQLMPDDMYNGDLSETAAYYLEADFYLHRGDQHRHDMTEARARELGYDRRKLFRIYNPIGLYH